MPRQARKKGEFSTYHIIQRGNERKNIFIFDDDRVQFLDILERMKKKYNFFVYTFCLMDNHVHLIIDDNGNDISLIIKSINISYASYFNRKYKRSGHLFQDRFKSELIDSDSYLLEVSRYIHNNPVKAGMVENPSGYRWSSYNIIAGYSKDLRNLINRNKILDYISNDSAKAIKGYADYVLRKEEIEANIMDVKEDGEEIENTGFICTLEQARQKLMELIEADCISYDDLLKDTRLRNERMKSIRRNSSLTLKQIGELFGGISESRVSRILISK